MLITIDTLRADAVSFANGGPDTTPFLATLAREGIVFDRAYAPSSWTAPSMASLFTSLEPASHGVVHGAMATRDSAPGLVAVNQHVLADSLLTMTESFRAGGFRTIGVAANSHLTAALGFGQGFDSYLEEAPFISARAVNRHVTRAMEAQFGPEWRRDWKRTPTFLWVHYFDPHAPYEARQPWAREFARERTAAQGAAAGLSFPQLTKRYADNIDSARAELEPLYWSEVRYVDEHIRALDRELGFSDPNVLVVVTSDHGEEFGEHGELGHGTNLYEESVRVPLFLRWPERLAQGERSAAPTTLLDIFPTLAALLGTDAPATTHGIALPLAELAQVGAARPIHLETRRSQPRTRAVRAGDEKLILRDFRQRRMRDQRRQLYDLARDPRELVNLADTQAARALDLERSIGRHHRSLPEPPADTRQETIADEAAVERLRQLGYGD